MRSSGRVVCDGGVLCSALAPDLSLTSSGLDQFEASLVGITATEYFCHKMACKR
jgi:hypothetical protein